MRKRPQQARSKQVVSNLIDATAQVIPRYGLEQTTTNHIAKRAGVSVGTLYQYFEDKNDLIEALLVQLSSEISHAVDETLAKVMEKEVEMVVHELLATALAAMESKKGLYLELARNWHRLHSLTVVNALEEHMMEACRRYILRHHQQMKIADNLPAVLFVVINSTLFTVIRYLSLNNPAISKQELIGTLSAMIAAYLQPGQSGPVQQP